MLRCAHRERCWSPVVPAGLVALLEHERDTLGDQVLPPSERTSTWVWTLLACSVCITPRVHQVLGHGLSRVSCSTSRPEEIASAVSDLHDVQHVGHTATYIVGWWPCLSARRCPGLVARSARDSWWRASVATRPPRVVVVSVAKKHCMVLVT